MEQSFSWVRRWALRDVGQPGLDIAEGAPLVDWSNSGCLVLLGEGGLGKSHELRAEKARLDAEGAMAYLCDLGRTTDRSALRDELLPRLPPDEVATLLIDGFDEVFDDVKDIADVLGDYLAGLDRSLVAVRIASRPVVWSTRLEARLCELWPRGDVAALTLEPVNADDIQTAAETRLSSGQAVEFMRLIGERDLWSLAGSPITLRFLLDWFDRSGSLEGDRLAIHRQGIVQLVAEQHDRRLDRRRSGPPKATRLSIARELAYLSMFGGRPFIETRRSIAHDVVELEDVAREDDVEPHNLDAIAQSGLFRPADGTAVTWAHRSLAELLAADHIREWPLPTLLNLLTQPTQPNAIAPQLVGVAGWVALENPTLFGWLLEHDFTVVLNSNVADLPEPCQRQVADQLVDRVLSGESFGWSSLGPRGLATAHLTDSFRQHLTNPAVTVRAKQELVRIVGASDQHGLDDVLIELIRQGATVGEYTTEVALGRWAATALHNRTDRGVLSALADIASAPGTNKWTRADLLDSVYPGRISTVEVIALLPADALLWSDATFFGLVRRVGAAAAEDVDTLVAFLRWLSSQPDHVLQHPFDPLQLTNALDLAVSHLDRRDVLDAAARLIGRRAEVSHMTDVGEAFVDLPAGQRHELLEAAVVAADQPWLVTRVAAYRLVKPEDFDHFVGGLAELDASDPTCPLGDSWLDAAASAALVHRPTDSHHRLVEDAKARHPRIAEFLEQRWGAGFRQVRRQVLADAEAAELRRQAERSAEFFDIGRFDAAIAAGRWDAVAYELERPVEETTGQRTPQHGLDHLLSSGPAWQHLDGARRGSAITAAVGFIEAASLNGHTSIWIGDAIALVADTAPEELDHVESARWVALVELIIRGGGHHDTAAMVINRAAAHDRATVDQTLLKCLDADVAAGSTLTLDRLGDHVPAGLEQRLLDLADDDSVSHHPCRRLLRAAMGLHAPHAAEIARGIIGRRPPRPATTDRHPPDGSPGADQLRLWQRAAAAGAALAHGPSGVVAGEDVLSMLTGDWDFTAAVVAHVGMHPGDGFLATLTADEMATLYLWVDRFVVQPLHPPRQGYAPNPVHEFPNTLLHVIGAQADDPAVAALDRIASETNSSDIRRYAATVRRSAHASTWQPIELPDLRQIATDTTRRAIRTPEELAAATREALVQISDAIRTDAAQRQRFWHHQSSTDCWVPRDEEGASDQLRLMLTERLSQHVTVNREVRIEPRIGHQSASEVDLLVTVASDGPEISCIVEVKANWYPRLVERVRTQLADRYLRGPHGDAGLFVVLWFAGDAWCDKDRARRRPLKNLAPVKSKLATAIAKITNGYVASVVIDCTLERHP
jgi:hypothetical protein